MIRVFSLPQNYHCPTTKDDYGTVAKINQELDLTSALTLYFIPFSAPLIVKLIKHAQWWLSFFIVCDVSRWFLGIQEQHTMIAASSSGAAFFAWQRRARNASDW